jgi:hypothetical protein
MKKKETTTATATVSSGGYERERKQFRALLLGNPNYFGNLENSQLQPVLPLTGNTFYEELGCIGFQPERDQLEAVVFLKRASGYSGGVCSGGSQEYVRFYLSFDNGASWVDQGAESITVYDIPGVTEEKRLEYAVSRRIRSSRLLCKKEQIIKMRAILSWGIMPPPNQPNWPPIWGERQDAQIQIGKFVKARMDIALKDFQVSLPADIAAHLDLSQSLQALPSQSLSLGELLRLYRDNKNVPPHRFLYSHLQQVISQPQLNIAALSDNLYESLVKLGLKPADIIAQLLQTDGDTHYEELGCVGFDPVNETLVGVLTVKLPYGFSGDLCTTGSQEYVTFWVDWNEDGIWDFAGAASVNVFDLKNIPSGGLQYAVVLPIPAARYRRSCKEGPRTASVRAILSWNTPHTNPNTAPVWGNREDTRILIPPGNTVKSGDYTPFLKSLCDVPVCSIEQGTGLASPNDRPFGGDIRIFGEIPGAPEITASAGIRPKYRVQVRPQGGAWQTLTNSFWITIEEKLGSAAVTSAPFLQEVDASNYYTWQTVTPSASGWRSITPQGLLVVWQSSPETGRWEIRVEAKDSVGNTYIGGALVCIDGTTRSSIVVRLDQKAPEVALKITEYSSDGGATRKPAANCGTYRVGDILYGKYGVSDEHFSNLTLTVEPAGAAHGATVNPSSRSYPTVSTNGETGEWSLNTKGMDACGYVVQLIASDRTIVSCSGGHSDSLSVGFCLVKP